MLQINFLGDHNLGMYAKATNEILLIGNSVPKNLIQKISDKLKTAAIKVTIANADLVGIFCCLNSNGIVIPQIATNEELEKFKNFARKFDMNFSSLKTKFTAIGNLVLCNDTGAIVSKNFSQKNKKIIEDCLGVETTYSTVAGMSIVGSAGIATNKGCLLHRDATEDEIKIVEEALKVNVDIGTANFGSPFVGCCIIANSNDTIVGESTTGPEIVRIYQALGFYR